MPAQTQYPEVQKAIDAIGREQILGVVLNGVESPESESYYYYGATHALTVRFITGSFPRQLALVVVEHVLIVLAVVAAALATAGLPGRSLRATLAWVARAIVVAAVLQVCLHYGDLYDLRTTGRPPGPADRRAAVARRRLGDPGDRLLLGARPGARARRRRPRHAAHHGAADRVAHRLRMAVAPRAAGRAPAHRRQQRRRGQPRPRAVRAAQ